MSVWLQDDPPVRPEPVKPRPLPVIVETIGEHEFELLSDLCLYCGTPIEDAATKTCGPR